MSNTQEKAQHTAGPWRIDPQSSPIMVESITETWPLIDDDGSEFGRTGAFVCNTGDSHANARRIVQCVNSHDELVQTLRGLHFLCNALMGELGLEPETTEFKFKANGKDIATLTAGDFMRGADKVIAKAGAPA